MQCKLVHIGIDIDADPKHLYANIIITSSKLLSLILRLCMILTLLIRILICFAIGNMVLQLSALLG